jgi:hypothetical protein
VGTGGLARVQQNGVSECVAVRWGASVTCRGVLVACGGIIWEYRALVERRAHGVRTSVVDSLFKQLCN